MTLKFKDSRGTVEFRNIAGFTGFRDKDGQEIYEGDELYGGLVAWDADHGMWTYITADGRIEALWSVQGVTR